VPVVPDALQIARGRANQALPKAACRHEVAEDHDPSPNVVVRLDREAVAKRIREQVPLNDEGPSACIKVSVGLPCKTSWLTRYRRPGPAPRTESERAAVRARHAQVLWDEALADAQSLTVLQIRQPILGATDCGTPFRPTWPNTSLESCQ